MNSLRTHATTASTRVVVPARGQVQDQVQALSAAPRRYRWRSYLVSYLLIAPAIIALSLFVIYPLINLVYMSLFQGNAAFPYKKYIGVDNYERLFFVKKDFWTALKNTAVYTLGILVSLMAFSVLAAVSLFRDRRLNRMTQTAFFTPYLIAGVSAGFIWNWLLSSQDYGLFNTVLNALGFSSLRWLDDSRTAMLSIIMMNTWKNFGYYALIIISSIKAIPAEIFEAADLDHASRWRVFYKIILPMISPQLFFLLITISTSSFQVFDSVRIMTGGGPGDATRVLSMYIYDYAFQRNNTLGYASAAGVVMFLILLVFTILNFRYVERQVHY